MPLHCLPRKLHVSTYVPRNNSCGAFRKPALTSSAVSSTARLSTTELIILNILFRLAGQLKLWKPVRKCSNSASPPSLHSRLLMAWQEENCRSHTPLPDDETGALAVLAAATGGGMLATKRGAGTLENSPVCILPSQLTAF